MQIGMTTSDFYGEKMNFGGLSLQLSLEPRKKCVKACPRVLECASAGKVPLWTVYRLHTPSVTGRLLSLVTAPLCATEATMFSRHLSWLQNDHVFHVLSSHHHDCQTSSRMGPLPA